VKRRITAVFATVLVAFLASGCQMCDGDPKPFVACSRSARPSCWVVQG
jgi:hypothetical protein